MNGYELSRNYFDWAFENPDINTPSHTATYMWIIDKWNRSGQVKKLVLPSSESMAAIGVKSYNTYIKVLNDLIEFGFIEMIQKSKNQFTANIIALSNFNKALDKALDKAMIKHTTKQQQSTSESNDSIYKQENKVTKEQENKVISFEKKEIKKYQHGEHKNVFLSEVEVNNLIEKEGIEIANLAVDKLSNYKLSNGKKYKSDYGAINQWVLESVKKSLNETKIQKNIIKKTEKNEQYRKTETAPEYLQRVGSGLDKILDVRFGRTSNQSTSKDENSSPNYSEYSLIN